MRATSVFIVTLFCLLCSAAMTCCRSGEAVIITEKMGGIDLSNISVNHELRTVDGEVSLNLSADGYELINAGFGPLYEGGGCSVKVSAEKVCDGVLIHYDVENASDTFAEAPEFRIAGINLPFRDCEYVNNWHIIQFGRFRKSTEVSLHSMRTYPNECYSPVLGLRTQSVFLGTSFIYDVFGLRKEVHPNYKYDSKTGRWTMLYRLVDGHERVGNRRRLTAGRLPAGAKERFTIAVQAVPPKRWTTGFSVYRDHFRRTFGNVRYRRDPEPVYALSLASGRVFGEGGKMNDSNPRGYNADTRMDIHGWPIFKQVVRDRVYARGFNKVLVWQIAGFYRKHPQTNMVWEIYSGWPEKMRETTDDLKDVIDWGVTVGFWMGRAFGISGGFDTGKRHAWNPDNPEDNEAAFRELDGVYKLGIRMIGGDAISSGIAGTDWSVSSAISFLKIFPMLQRRYPAMEWVIETACCDYLHLWGGSFVWEQRITEPFDFADYISPGHQTYSVLKRSRMRDEVVDRTVDEGGRSIYPGWQGRMEELCAWGYTPIVFCDQGGQGVLINGGRKPQELPEIKPSAK